MGVLWCTGLELAEEAMFSLLALLNSVATRSEAEIDLLWGICGCAIGGGELTAGRGGVGPLCPCGGNACSDKGESDNGTAWENFRSDKRLFLLSPAPPADDNMGMLYGGWDEEEIAGE